MVGEVTIFRKTKTENGKREDDKIAIERYIITEMERNKETEKYTKRPRTETNNIIYPAR